MPGTAWTGSPSLTQTPGWRTGAGSSSASPWAHADRATKLTPITRADTRPKCFIDDSFVRERSELRHPMRSRSNGSRTRSPPSARDLGSRRRLAGESRQCAAFVETERIGERVDPVDPAEALVRGAKADAQREMLEEDTGGRQRRDARCDSGGDHGPDDSD